MAQSVYTLSGSPVDDISIKLSLLFEDLAKKDGLMMTADLNALAKNFLNKGTGKKDLQSRFQSISEHASNHIALNNSFKGSEDDDFAEKIFDEISRKNEKMIADIKSHKVDRIGIATALLHRNECSYCVLACKISINKKPIMETIEKFQDRFTKKAMLDSINDIMVNVKHPRLAGNEKIQEFLAQQNEILTKGIISDVVVNFNEFFRSTGNFFICPVNSLKINEMLKEVFKEKEFSDFIFSSIFQLGVDMGFDKDRQSWLLFGAYYDRQEKYIKFTPEEKEEISKKIFKVINSIRDTQGKGDIPEKLTPVLFRQYNETKNKLSLEQFGEKYSKSCFAKIFEGKTKDDVIKETSCGLLSDKGREMITKATCSFVSPKVYDDKVTISVLLIEEKERNGKAKTEESKPKNDDKQKENKPKKDEEKQKKDKPKNVEEKPKKDEEKEKKNKPKNVEEKPKKDEEKPKKDKPKNVEEKPKKDEEKPKLKKYDKPTDEQVLQMYNSKRTEFSCQPVVFGKGLLEEKTKEFCESIAASKVPVIKKASLENWEGFSNVQSFVLNKAVKLKISHPKPNKDANQNDTVDILDEISKMLTSTKPQTDKFISDYDMIGYYGKYDKSGSPNDPYLNITVVILIGKSK